MKSDSDHVLLMSAIDSVKELKRWSSTENGRINTCKNDIHDKDKCQESKDRCQVICRSENEYFNEDRRHKEGEHVLMSHDPSHAEEEDCWYLDIGCSNHITSKKDWLIDLDQNVRSSV